MAASNALENRDERCDVERSNGPDYSLTDDRVRLRRTTKTRKDETHEKDILVFFVSFVPSRSSWCAAGRTMPQILGIGGKRLS